MLGLTRVILWYSLKIFFWKRTHCACLWFHWWVLKHWYRVNLLYCRFGICLSWIDFSVFSRWERSTVGVSVCLWVDWCLQHWRCAAGLWADWWWRAAPGGHQPEQLRHRHRPPQTSLHQPIQVNTAIVILLQHILVLIIIVHDMILFFTFSAFIKLKSNLPTF